MTSLTIMFLPWRFLLTLLHYSVGVFEDILKLVCTAPRISFFNILNLFCTAMIKCCLAKHVISGELTECFHHMVFVVFVFCLDQEANGFSYRRSCNFPSVNLHQWIEIFFLSKLMSFYKSFFESFDTNSHEFEAWKHLSTPPPSLKCHAKKSAI